MGLVASAFADTSLYVFLIASRFEIRRGGRDAAPTFVGTGAIQFDFVELVGMPGIEPGLHAPEACVLPVYYIPPVYFRYLNKFSAGASTGY